MAKHIGSRLLVRQGCIFSLYLFNRIYSILKQTGLEENGFKIARRKLLENWWQSSENVNDLHPLVMKVERHSKKKYIYKENQTNDDIFSSQSRTDNENTDMVDIACLLGLFN